MSAAMGDTRLALTAGPIDDAIVTPMPTSAASSSCEGMQLQRSGRQPEAEDSQQSSSEHEAQQHTQRLCPVSCSAGPGSPIRRAPTG